MPVGRRGRAGGASGEDDPESDELGGLSRRDNGGEDEDGAPVDEYFVPVESKLRRAQPLVLAGSKYAGRPVSRRDLEASGASAAAENDESDADQDDLSVDLESDEDDGGEEGEEEEEEDEDDADPRLALALGQTDDPFLQELRRVRSGPSAAAPPRNLTEQAQDEVTKGQHVKRQLAFGDKLLDLRIRLQRVLPPVNRLPDYETMPHFAASDPVRAQLQALQSAFRDTILRLQRLQQVTVTQLADACRNEGVEVPVTDAPADADGDTARAGEAGKLWATLQQENARFVPLRNAAFDHWSARLQAAASGSARKTFRALNQGLAVQLQQLLADRDRLRKRIHTNRAQYRVLGSKRTAEMAGLNEEIIDDSDFYQQLLAEVIESKAAAADGDDNDPAVLARQWLAVRQYHQKVKNRVDTKASKGRKIRYDAHSKLVNFMVPVEAEPWPEAMREELFAGLFGRAVRT